MKQELDEQLVKDFPLLYRDRHGDKRETCMVWGFPGDGWEPILRELSAGLESEIKKFLSQEDVPCICGCHVLDHDGNNNCTAIFDIPYHIGRGWQSHALKGYVYKPKTLKAKVKNVLIKSKFNLTIGLKWKAERVVNRFLQFLSNKFDINRKIPCGCKSYYPNHPRASQVKEKFGTLRFYMTSETPRMSELIRIAEDLSEVTCEDCGKPGSRRGREDGRYWVLTLCDACHEEGLRGLRR